MEITKRSNIQQDFKLQTADPFPTLAHGISSSHPIGFKSDDNLG